MQNRNAVSSVLIKFESHEMNVPIQNCQKKVLCGGVWLFDKIMLIRYIPIRKYNFYTSLVLKPFRSCDWQEYIFVESPVSKMLPQNILK